MFCKNAMVCNNWKELHCKSDLMKSLQATLENINLHSTEMLTDANAKRVPHFFNGSFGAGARKGTVLVERPHMLAALTARATQAGDKSMVATHVDSVGMAKRCN
eukprot:gnl/TRDRNA2_/TRDRNA2_127772_c3_seq1.p1 gnl/TRDRNA2_/TRDRNA2_127772_c3~~gnl/TRDRNA2_/TRDRNA2_127772_c3_seq1.p1  ORF type:complete len:104 (+),score=12.57 gnl/TRDRNA2_/TRDRNA2_127772_c3_seq1:1-312(+)